MSDRQHNVTESLPCAPDMENGLLSCLMHNPSVLVPDAQVSIPPRHFYHTGRRLLYETILSRHAAGHEIEYLGLSQHLEDTGLMERIGGRGFFAEVEDFTPTPKHYDYYKGILRDKSTLRDLMSLADEAKAECREHHEDVPALLGTITEKFFALSKQQQGVGRKSFRAIMNDYVDTWEARMAGRITTGIPTRWRTFNKVFGGILPRLWLIAGFPSDGKSSLLQNMVEDTLAHGKHVLWFSYEMEETEIVDRLITARTELDSQDVFFPQNGCSRDATKKITAAVGELQGWPLHLRCESTWTADQIVAEARALVLKYPIGLVAIDYLQLVPSDRKFNTRAEEVAFMSRTFKLGSASLGLPFIVLSQLNDDGKTKESRAPNQDSSNILFIEKEATTTDRKNKSTTTPAGLRVVKNRNGKRGDLLPIRLCGPTFTFVEDLKP